MSPPKAVRNELHIDRIETSANGTFSQLWLYAPTGEREVLPYYGLECPWRDNRPNVSCIPAGWYYLEEHLSNKFGAVPALVGGCVSHYGDITGLRSHILIHPANRAVELKGCLAVGDPDRDKEGRLYRVLNARKRWRELVDRLQPLEQWRVHIQWD